MYSDYALLLQTVLDERGCVDDTLQATAQTVPFVYRVLAEHNVYFLYAVSVVKALLHEKDAAFAHLARWQIHRSASPHVTGDTPTSAVPCQSSAPADMPAIAPSDALDMRVTILGGGTCCELLLGLLYDGGPHTASSSSGPLLVHPTHLSVVTRQPERLARHAQRGVHCLRRHHGREAVRQSDVVLLTCPPALFREVAQDLNSVPAASAESDARGLDRKKTDTAASLRAAVQPPSLSVLQPSAVLLSCMAGVPARKVALAFHRTPELTLVTHITPQDGVHGNDEDDGEAEDRRLHDSGGSGAPRQRDGGDAGRTSTLATTSASARPPPPPISLHRVAVHYNDAMEDYKEARMADMRCHISFLRPAVLQQQQLMRATSNAASTAAAFNAVPIAGNGGDMWQVEKMKRGGAPGHARSIKMCAPRRADFTAGRHRATAPSLDAFLDLWRLLQAYVKATFAEALRKARMRGHTARTAVGESSGLISVVLPDGAPSVPPRAVGEVEAELLPALTLLPASKTMAVWTAWWRSGLSGSTAPVSLSRVAGSLSARVTSITGGWLSTVYTSDEAFVVDLELQYQRVLEGQLPKLY